MEEIATPYGIIDLSTDWREFYRRELQQAADLDLSRLDRYIDDLLGKYFSKAASQIKRGSGAEIDLINMRMLLADGDSEDFLQGIGYDDSYDKVKMWVGHYDGCHDALIVKAFNPGGVALETRNTYLLYSVNNPRSLRSKEDNRRDVLTGVAYYDIAKPPRFCLERNLHPTPTSVSPVNPVEEKRDIVGDRYEIYNLRDGEFQEVLDFQEV